MNLRPPYIVLVVGKDARTEAIAAACKRSGLVASVLGCSELAHPGLIGRCDDFLLVDSLDENFDEILTFARERGVNLLIVGPEEPLAAGIVDFFEAAGIACFGPGQRLAQIESSKGWARDLVARHGIDGNPRFHTFNSLEGVEDYMRELGDFVVKPDGLTGGKGVRVLGEHMHSVEEAVAYAAEVLSDTVQPQLVIEERLEGEEFSLQSITDGQTIVHCPAVQDHKRAFEDDSGPNTGGMGSYSCSDGSLPFLAPSDLATAQRINEEVVAALRAETGIAYKGVLYGGFIATADGVRLIEYNARFGDPEAMNVLPLLTSDFVEMCAAVATGSLAEDQFQLRPSATVCKYVVPASYPGGGLEAGRPVTVPVWLRERDNVEYYWAAAQLQSDGTVELTGSRALAIVGIGSSLEEAELIAEEAASSIGGPVRHRTDIGGRKLVESRRDHMLALRSRRSGS